MLINVQKNLEPVAFVRSALTCAREELVKGWGDCILLIQLEDPQGPMAATLRNGLSGPLPSAAVKRVATHTIADVAISAPHAEESWPESLVVHQLRGRLVRMLHYAMPIHKRPQARGAAPEDRYMIGRGRENDLLLVDESVSKRHAWMKRSDDGKYTLGDVGSRNGTTVNGKSVAAPRSCILTPGDVLCFGKIEVMLCPTEAAWDALRRS